MNIIVFVRQTPDTNSEIELNDSMTGIKVNDGFILNPNDEFAVKEAVDLKNKFGGEVVAVGLGSDSVQKVLRTCLAKGADRAVHLLANNVDNMDPFSVAVVLADNVKNIFREKNETFDLILCGSKSVDTDNGVVGIQLACLLDIACISSIVKLEVDVAYKKITASRCAGDFLEITECSFPALLSCQKGLNNPSSIIPLRQIMQANKKRLDVVPVSGKIKTSEVISVEFAPKKEPGRILAGSPDDQIKELAVILKEKAKGAR